MINIPKNLTSGLNEPYRFYCYFPYMYFSMLANCCSGCLLIFPYMYFSMLANCCSGCAKCSIVEEIENTMQLNQRILNQSDLIFPVLSDSLSTKVHGFHFLPVYKVPVSYYLSLRKSNSAVLREVLTAYRFAHTL